MDCSVLLTLEHLYSAGSACVLTIIAWVAHRYGQLYLHLSLIYFWVHFQLFLQKSALSEGEIIPFSGVCQSGGGCIIHAGGGMVASRTDWQTALMCNRRRPAAASHHAEHHFSALASANSFVYFASNAATCRKRICMSVIAAFNQLQFSGILSRWAL